MITVDSDGVALPDDFAAVVGRGEQTVLVRLQVDFDADGYGGVDDISRWADGVSVDRSLATDLPAQVRLATGYSAAELKADLVRGLASSDATDAATYFTRGSAVSPIGAKERIRRPTVLDVGYLTATGPVYVRRFTGLSRALPSSAKAGTAALAALDLRERLRETVILIPTDGDQAGADGTWIVTQVLYANGIGAGPLPRSAGGQIWTPMYGSLNSIGAARDPSWMARLITSEDVGFLSSVRPVFRSGPFVTAISNVRPGSDTDFSRVAIARAVNDMTWDGLRGRLEMWVIGVPNPTTGITDSQGRTFGILSENGQLPAAFVGVRHSGALFFDTHDVADAIVDAYTSSFVVPGDGAFHFVGIAWDFVAQQIRFRLDGREETIATSTTPATDLPALANWWQFTSYVSCADIHLHGPLALDEAWLSDLVDIRAYIDQSALQLVACYEAQPRESWELLAELADSEQAVSLFDPAGNYHYRTRARLSDDTGQTVQSTLRSDVALLDAEIDDGIDQIRNIVQIGFTPVNNPGLFTFIYLDDQQRVFPARTVVDFVISFTDPTIKLQTSAFFFNIPDFILFDPVANNLDPFVVVTLNADFSSDGRGVFVYTSQGLLTFEVRAWNSSAASIRITNAASVNVYATAMGLKGAKVVLGGQVTAEARDQASIERWGAQPLQLDGSQWIQSDSAALGIARALLGDLREPRRSISRLAVIGDPRRELGDRTAIDYPTRPELSGEYWITAITDETTGRGEYTQELAVREASTVLRWDIGRWDVDTWG